MSRLILSHKSDVVIRKGSTPITGENVILDTDNYTIEVLAEIDGRAIISALDDYWHSEPGMSLFRFPIYAIDETSAKYSIGYDGNLYNAWHWKDAVTKAQIKSIGWRQYSSMGVIQEEWFGVTTPPGGIPDNARPYYQKVAGGDPIIFTHAGAVNEAVQVYGDASHGNFDNRSFFRIFAREAEYVFSSADLASVSRSATGAYSQAFGLTITPDDKITHSDVVVNDQPYNNIVLNYYTTPQMCDIGGSMYPFEITIDNAVANLNRFQMYERSQYLLRQNSDISQTAVQVIGKTADSLMWFVGTTLYTRAYIYGLDVNDINDVVFVDQSGVERRYPFASAGTFTFDSLITGAPVAKYSVLFFDPSAFQNDEWGTAGAVIVNDKDGNPITGTVGGVATKSWSFDYDGNTQGNRTPGTDARCVIVVTAPGHIRYKSQEFTISRAVGQKVDVKGSEPPYYLV